MPGAKVRELGTEKGFRDAVGSPGINVLCFGATWCRPCKLVAPEYEKLAEQFEKAKFYKIDVDELDTVSQRCRIKTVPTFLVIRDGKNVGNVVGSDIQALRRILQNIFREDVDLLTQTK